MIRGTRRSCFNLTIRNAAGPDVPFANPLAGRRLPGGAGNLRTSSVKGATELVRDPQFVTVLILATVGLGQNGRLAFAPPILDPMCDKELYPSVCV